jgi:hypothetical protein
LNLSQTNWFYRNLSGKPGPRAARRLNEHIGAMELASEHQFRRFSPEPFDAANAEAG